MKLENILIKVEAAHSGMCVGEMFDRCLKYQVPSLPFVDADGRITGRLSIKNCLKRSCLPEHMVEMADVLSPKLSCLKNAEAKAKQVLTQPVDQYLLKPPKAIKSDSAVMKVLAMMEKMDTGFLFVVDENGIYQGVVTIQSLANRMLELRDAEGQNDDQKICS